MRDFINGILPRFEREMELVDQEECPGVYNLVKGHLEGARALLKLIDESNPAEVSQKVSAIARKARSDADISTGKKSFYERGVYEISEDFSRWLQKD